MRRKSRDEEIAPDEIFLDSHNLPQFDTAQFEGRIEQPITQGVVRFFGGFFLLLALALVAKVTMLQVVEGASWSGKNGKFSIGREGSSVIEVYCTIILL